MSIYDSLNPEQKKAVLHDKGPLLILAGAGSGKTRVLTHRIAYLIEEREVNPWNILAITFTNKAAKEMRERVDRIVGYGSENIWVSTFHSTCVRILRRFIDTIGYSRSFTIYDTLTAENPIRHLRQIPQERLIRPLPWIWRLGYCVHLFFLYLYLNICIFPASVFSGRLYHRS
jgi:DNA helicase-2/ATP-dependent DNA helicase PcrA